MSPEEKAAELVFILSADAQSNREKNLKKRLVAYWEEKNLAHIRDIAPYLISMIPDSSAYESMLWLCSVITRPEVDAGLFLPLLPLLMDNGALSSAAALRVIEMNPGKEALAAAVDILAELGHIRFLTKAQKNILREATFPVSATLPEKELKKIFPPVYYQNRDEADVFYRSHPSPYLTQKFVASHLPHIMDATPQTLKHIGKSLEERPPSSAPPSRVPVAFLGSSCSYDDKNDIDNLKRNYARLHDFPVVSALIRPSFPNATHFCKAYSVLDTILTPEHKKDFLRSFVHDVDTTLLPYESPAHFLDRLTTALKSLRGTSFVLQNTVFSVDASSITEACSNNMWPAFAQTAQGISRLDAFYNVAPPSLVTLVAGLSGHMPESMPKTPCRITGHHLKRPTAAEASAFQRIHAINQKITLSKRAKNKNTSSVRHLSRKM